MGAMAARSCAEAVMAINISKNEKARGVTQAKIRTSCPGERKARTVICAGDSQ